MSIEFKDRPIIITDFETTGIYPTYHEVIDIGAIKVDHDLEEIGRYEAKISPRYLWADAIPLQDAFKRYMNFAKDGILCAWNITFEYSFLEENLTWLKLPNLMDYHRIDIPSIAWALGYGRSSMNMDLVAAEFDLPSEPKPHTGIGGAEQELKILRRLHANAVVGRTEY